MDSRKPTANSQQWCAGFTLIEMIIASGIFSSVLLMGFAVFADIGRVSDRTSGQRHLGQTTRAVVETAAREIRLANGILEVRGDGTVTQSRPPFVFLDGQTINDGRTQASAIQINSTEFPTPFQTITVVREIAVVDGTQGDRYLELRECERLDCVTYRQRARLTADDIIVEQFKLVGVQPTLQARTLPVLSIELTLRQKSVTGLGGDQIRQTVTTTITPRNFGRSLR